MRFRLISVGAIVMLTAMFGCGTTRLTDTPRTATEQMLVSNSVDEAVSAMNFRALSGKTVFFEEKYLDGVVDKSYLISSIRQHLLASGCLLQEDRTKADYVVEARAGAIGTDRHDVLFGVPQFNIPPLVPGYPSGLIPEIPIAKKTDKKGVAKVAVFAYNRTTGRPLYQSGIAQASSTAKDLWLFGTGPFQRGTIYDGTEFAGEPIQIPLLSSRTEEDDDPSLHLPVTRMATFTEPAAKNNDKVAGQPEQKPKEAPEKTDDAPGVVQASDTSAQHGPPPNPIKDAKQAKAPSDEPKKLLPWF